MVEVFKTNIQHPQQSAKLLGVLNKQFPWLKINIDLHDCDKILRVEGDVIHPGILIEILMEHGFQCVVLE